LAKHGLCRQALLIKPPGGFADITTVTLLFAPRIRALMIVGVLALAAVGAGLMVLSRSQSSTDASPGPAATPKPAVHSPSSPAPAVSGRKAPATPTATADRLPVAIQQALAANRVVVVALYDPKAKIDGTALSEASAGAQLAGTTFVPIDVTKGEVGALNARYGVIQDPAVLVLRPPGNLVVRIDGFADRDTVAQAAANAAS
jgi:hypothetical protein